MANPTAPSVARPASVFAPGGIQWVAIPVGLEGPARDVWGALMQLERSTTIITAPDWRIADVIGRSARYVQEGLRALELAGMIERLRRHGRRVITVVARLAGRTSAPDPSTGARTSAPSCTDSHRRAKPYRWRPAAPIRTDVHAPSSEGINEKKTPGPSVAASTPAGPEAWDRGIDPRWARLFPGRPILEGG